MEPLRYSICVCVYTRAGICTNYYHGANCLRYGTTPLLETREAAEAFVRTGLFTRAGFRDHNNTHTRTLREDRALHTSGIQRPQQQTQGRAETIIGTARAASPNLADSAKLGSGLSSTASKMGSKIGSSSRPDCCFFPDKYRKKEKKEEKNHVLPRTVH